MNEPNKPFFEALKRWKIYLSGQDNWVRRVRFWDALGGTGNTLEFLSTPWASAVHSRYYKDCQLVWRQNTDGRWKLYAQSRSGYLYG